MPLSVEKKSFKAGARGSPLSLVQVQEVLQELRHHSPEVDFELTTFHTTGDKDLQTSLRTLDKTDFFTKEIDRELLTGKIRLAIHSAKDLPDPLPKGLAIAAITKGVDSSDSLVLRPGESLAPGMTIATSSERREAAVRQLCEGLHFQDVRGSIHQRLEKLQREEVDGVVIAEAALIRLGLTHLNRIPLPGETAALQGKLAVIVREEDEELLNLFSSIDTRKKCLYLGLECPPSHEGMTYIHYPVITTVPRNPADPKIVEAFQDLPRYTHLIFTSKTGVRTFFQFLGHFNPKLDHLTMIAVGAKTAEELQLHGVENPIASEDETAEGIVALLESLPLDNPYFFWPHSALSRTLISSFLKARRYRFKDCVLYDTHSYRPAPPPSLDRFDALFFTSPSTVKAFRQIFGNLPDDKELLSIGPITKEAIELYRAIQ